MNAKNFIKYFIPKRLLKTRRNYLIAKKIAENKFHYTNRGKKHLSKTLTTVKVCFTPDKTISFYPQLPRKGSVLFDLCAYLNYTMVLGPDPKADYEIVYHDSTYTNYDQIKSGITDLNKAVNGKCTDISKKYLQHCFEEVFGYSLALDPATHQGPILKKSNLNYTHDGKILTAPLEPAEIDDTFVYQKVVNTQTEDGFFLDYRVPIYGNEIPLVYGKFRPANDRFRGFSHAKIFSVENIFSNDELTQILKFSNAINLDSGELDILRDNNNGKIYIVDANDTPFHRLVSDDLKKITLGKLANSFQRMLRQKIL